MTTDKDEMARKLGLGRHKPRGPWRVIGLAAALILGVGTWAVLTANSTGQQAVYVTEPARIAELEVTVSANGTVEPTDLVEISSELSGTIDTVHVDYNDRVEEGTVLARLDTARLEATLAVQRASLASAEANVTAAEANLEEALEAYERGVELEQRGVESHQALVVQEAAFNRAAAQLQSAIALRDLAQANVDLVQVDLTTACICSPVTGVVLERNVDAGQIVAASLSAPVLFTIAEDLARMELQVDIDEADIGQVAVGQPAVFTVDAHDGRIFPAEITQVRLAPETLDGVVTYKGILTIDNSDMALRPGMTATAEITVASVSDALVVPNAALRYTPPRAMEAAQSSGSGLVGMVMPGRPVGGDARESVGSSVWVLRDGAEVEVPVETGESDGDVTAIRAGDLAAGDAVITDRIDAE